MPCRVENSTFDVLYQRKCAMDLQCNVGPADSTLNTTAIRMFYCALPGKYFVRTAYSDVRDKINISSICSGLRLPEINTYCSMYGSVFMHFVHFASGP